MLDLFFRKYAWTANLALLFAAAWLTAKTVNTLVGASIRPRPQADLALPPPAPPRPALAVPLDDTRVYHLIGVEPPKVVESDAPPVPTRPQNCQDPNAQPVKSDLRLTLVASVMGERSRFSLATIADPSTRQTMLLATGDLLPGGAEFIGLQRSAIDHDGTGNGTRVVAVICNGGTKEFIDDGIANPGGAPDLASAGNVGFAPVPAPAAPGAPMTGVRPTGKDRYEIERSVIDSTLNNLNNIATQARIVPSFKNGQANGFKLFSIQPGSLYSSIGIENGDVIQRINGFEINSPEKALELYQKLREAGHVTIEGERGGQTFKKEYNITGP